MKINESYFKKCASDLMFELKKETYPFLKQDFEMMINYMNSINKIKGLNDLEPMTFPFPISKIDFRKDDITSFISQAEAFSNAKEIEKGELKVPKVVI